VRSDLVEAVPVVSFEVQIGSRFKTLYNVVPAAGSACRRYPWILNRAAESWSRPTCSRIQLRASALFTGFFAERGKAGIRAIAWTCCGRVF